ncbi:Na+/H+ antiporter NhaA, partial [Francisella tularensis]|uniref:Na+/H+ antiporter NhaA n=1 Tax=Francisella tularensis TaxID=263 RepID=UPI002381971C
VLKKLKWFNLGESVSNLPLYGISLVGGLGFTVCLVIGVLACNDTHVLSAIKIGGVGGSVHSGFFGYIVLRCIVSNPS